MRKSPSARSSWSFVTRMWNACGASTRSPRGMPSLSSMRSTPLLERQEMGVERIDDRLGMPLGERVDAPQAFHILVTKLQELLALGDFLIRDPYVPHRE